MTTHIERLKEAPRWLSVLVSFQIMSDFISPALWVLNERVSVISNIARLATNPTALALCWLAAAVMVLPFVLLQLFAPECHYRRTVIKIANYGIILGALVWVFMAFLARNLDYNFAVWNFLFNGFISLTFAALMASGLNNDQKERHHKKACT